jgi:AAA domain-containing protein
MRFVQRGKGQEEKMRDDDFLTQALLANSRTVVKAKYREPEIPKFAGNPNIEALPLINTRKQALDGMQRLPSYSDEVRLLPAHLRTHLVMDVLHYFQPLSIHLKLEGMFSRTIRDGYLPRNPLNPAHSSDLKMRLKHFKNCSIFGEQFSPSGCGFTMCGMSGVGKTTGLIRVLNLYPQVVIHTNYRRRRFTRAQIVWLILECPKDGSTKGLCTKFFKAIDYVMGGTTTYSKDYGKESRSTNDLMESMANVAATHQLGVMIIDEIQYLNVAKSGGAEEMLNFFVNLVNTIGLPVIIVGTYDAIPLLTGTFRQARRGSGQGDLVWDRMPFDEEWHLFAEALWEYQYVQKKCPLKEQLSRALHDVSYGIIDIANRIYLAAQVRAIEKGTEEITEGLLRSAYRDDFRLVSHIIETLKTGDPSLLHNIRDVCPPTAIPIKERAANSSVSASNVQKTEEIEHASSEGNQGIPLPSPSIDVITITDQQSSAPQRDQIFPSNAQEAVAKIERKRRSRKSKAIQTDFDTNDLRGVVARGQASTPQLEPYVALLTVGYIKDSTEFLPKDC